jgi:hypothetical protein
MNKITGIFFLLLVTIISVKGQETAKAPKFYSLEMGYRYIPATTFDIKKQGVTLLFDYAWQLSGFTGSKPAAYISVPLGYTYLFTGNGANAGRILSYGWTVKHDLKASGKAIPYFGYGLLLNQLKVTGTDGSIFGHQTRFDIGYLFKTGRKANAYTKLEYSFTRYPRFGQKKSDTIHAAEVKVGVRF